MLFHSVQGAGGQNFPPIEYVGGYTEGFSGQTASKTITFGGNLTGGLDSSASTGDLVIVWLSIPSSTLGNLDLSVTGYTEIADVFANDTIDTNLGVFYKFMGSPADTTITLPNGTFDSALAGAVVIQVFRNVDSTTPLDVTRTTDTVTNTAIPNPPAITPVTQGAWVVSGAGNGHARGTQTFSSSDLTNFLSSGGDDVLDTTVGAGYIANWTSGAVNPAAFTFSGANNTSYSAAAVTVALRPQYVPYTPRPNPTPTVTLNTTDTDATPSTTYTFNYGASVGVGEFVVIVLTARASSGTGNWSSVSDSAGNTFTEAVDGTQPNNLTYTAIYYGTLTNAVTTSTTITATCNSVVDANHATVYVLTAVTGLTGTNSNPISSSASVSATATTTSGVGVAIHGNSTGAVSTVSVSSVSAGFTSGSNLILSRCSQYTAYGVFNTTPSSSISNTFTMSASANYASVMALFE